jgi:hypothetical protein
MTSQLTPLLASAMTEDRLRCARVQRAARPRRRRKASLLGSLRRAGRRARRSITAPTGPRLGI